MAILLFGVTAKSQIDLVVTNFISCDVDVSIVSVDATCRQVTNYGVTTLPPGGSITINDPAAVEFEMYARVDPLGANVLIAPIGASGICPWPTSYFDPVCGGVNINVTPSGPTQYDMNITP